MMNKWTFKNILLLIIIATLAINIFQLGQTIAEQNKSALTKQEETTLEKIATEWVKLGEWCLSRKLGKESRLCADKAEAVEPNVQGLKSLKEESFNCEDSMKDEDIKTYNSRLTLINCDIANYYDELSQIPDSNVKERCDKYLLTALELAPSDNRWYRVLTAVNNLVKDNQLNRAENMAGRAMNLNPPDRLLSGFKTVLDNAFIDNVILRSSLTHPIKYYFSLPKDYKRAKDKKWPVLICIEGAVSDFKERATIYRDKRGKMPYILVCPCTFSNTNDIKSDVETLYKYRQHYSDNIINEADVKRLEWDEQGMLAIINELQTNYDAESRVYITGFSGGGNITYRMIFKHPNLLNGAVLACANFISHGYTEFKDKFSAETLNLPIHIITGEKDSHREYTFGNKNIPGIESQTDQAEAVIKELGYRNYKRTMIPDMGHSAACDNVIAIFKPYWEGKKKWSDKLD